MNNIHDCGGLQNMGPLDIELNEPVFHQQWEKEIFTIALVCFMSGSVLLDDFRYEIEKMSVTGYLNSGYYEHWLHAIENLAYREGIFTAAELDQRMKELTA